MRKSWALALAFGSAVPLAASAHENPKLLSLAGAEIALARGNDAFYRNPAGIALGNFYSVELGYEDDLTNSDRRFAASITDGYDKALTGGIGYVFRDRLLEERGPAPDLTAASHRFDVALALRLSEGIALGMSGRYILSTATANGVTIDNRGFDAFTFDAGLMWRTDLGLSFGIVGTNLTNSDRPELPMGIGGGIGFNADVFTLEADVRHDFQSEKQSFAVGASALLGGVVSIRAGFSYDLATESSAISAGLGVQNNQFAADLGFRQKVSGTLAPGLDTERLLGLAVRGMPFM